METFKTVLWIFTTLACSGIIGWHVADYVKFKRNLNRKSK